MLNRLQTETLLLISTEKTRAQPVQREEGKKKQGMDGEKEKRRWRKLERQTNKKNGKLKQTQ